MTQVLKLVYIQCSFWWGLKLYMNCTLYTLKTICKSNFRSLFTRINNWATVPEYVCPFVFSVMCFLPAFENPGQSEV